MKLMIEGCDGVGKSTMAKQLAEIYGLNYLHITVEDPKDKGFYNALLQKTNLVQDRTLVSELVYPVVYGRTPSIYTLNDIKALLGKHETALLIILWCDPKTLRYRLKKNKPLSVLSNLDYINSKYQTIYFELLAQGVTNVIGIDTSYLNSEEALEQTLFRLEGYNELY